MTTLEDYGYGWNERGQRFYALKSGRRQGRVNMIAALCQQKLMAPFTVVGPCNRSVARDLVGKLPNSSTEARAGSGHG